MGILFQLFLDAALILVPTALLLYSHKNKQGKIKAIMQDTGLEYKGLKDFKNALVLLSVLVLVSFALVGLFTVLQANDLARVEQAIQALSPGMALYLITVRVFTEEYFFRGFLVKKIGALSSSIVFAIAHYAYWSFTEVVGAFVLGYVLALAYQRYGNLSPNIISHFLYNALAVLGVL